jgi:EF-P beta-lysylation protein EpmB
MSAIKLPGLLQKYRGRALVITTGACGIHCRYCFRRHFPYGEQHLDQNSLSQILTYLQQNQDISEIILSGGDPLVLSDTKLSTLFEQFASIPHLVRLRIHSRMPVVIPERITSAFLNACHNTRLQLVMVIHTNHANEIDTNVAQALQSLQKYGITLLNQAVLLNKINDSATTLIQLSEALFRIGVQPYYLHQLDRVSGAGHFEVDDDKAIALIKTCREQLPGYLVPRLVREIEGERYKRPLFLSKNEQRLITR